ncbi:unnamed protein product [Phyllotreta striolata]|uniref:Globin domain-containing protein n=1 Tax=Phyllotreta striolata TaxID=444603 RepID=A0A9N9U2H4_PHYSR|nr:unnamed protein product [Phyllotreta striolata]
MTSNKMFAAQQPAPNELYTPAYQPDDSNSIPFQEFTDSDINNERWDQQSTINTEGFMDVYAVLLPHSLQGYQWKPIGEYFVDTDFVVKLDDNPSYPDLMTANEHLMCSDFMRSFVTSMETLYYLSNVRQFSVEYVSQGFSPSFDKERWRPWHHVYSNCKSGKNYNHSPTVNKFGKYVVRLFWLGSWKKIYVSDKVPVSESDQLLLPYLFHSHFQNEETPVVSGRPKSEKSLSRRNVVELWPILLTKALMIVASLTWKKDNELLDFDIIQCLTGWIFNKIDTTYMDPLKVWQICMDYTSQYTWSDPISATPSTDRRKSSEQRKSSTRSNLLVDTKNRFVVVLGISLNSDKENIRDWTHGLLVVQTRTVPILKPSCDEEFEAWKRYRWIDWAIEHKLINPRCPPNPIRSFKTVDPFRCRYQSSVLSDLTMESKPSQDSKSKATNKPNANPPPLKDITEWLDLDQIHRQLKYVTIYYMPSTYKSKTRISNMTSENIPKQQKPTLAQSLVDLIGTNWKEIVRPLAMQQHRNEPLYIFSDSLEEQSVVVNLNYSGCLDAITTRLAEREFLADAVESECDLCISNYLERVKRYCARNARSEARPVQSSIVKVLRNAEHDDARASVVVTKFKWDSDRVDLREGALATLGSGCMVLHLTPGRHLFQMWLQVDRPYAVQVVSNGYLCVGTLEETLTLMGRDSIQFRVAYSSLVDTLRALVASFGRESYVVVLKEFYKCFKPKEEVTKQEWLGIQEAFFDKFFDSVQKTLGDDALRAVKILFRKWQLESSRRCDVNDLSQFCYRVFDDEKVYVKMMHDAATGIQSFFRGVYERLLTRHHALGSSRHSKTAVLLAGVVEKFVHNEKRLGEKRFRRAATLRKFIQSDELSDFRSKYTWYRTLDNDVSLALFHVNLKSIDNGWIFISRQIFHVRTEHPLTLRISLFCNLSRYYLVVYDNDTSEKMKSHVNDSAVNEYPANAAGYTAVAFGWADKQTFLNCKIMFACRPDNIEDYVAFSSKVPRKEVISNYYIPNNCNVLYILALKSDITNITLHLFTDYPKVNMKLSIFNAKEPDDKLVEVEGIGYVTVPSLTIENKLAQLTEKESSCTVELEGKSRKDMKHSKKDLLAEHVVQQDNQIFANLKIPEERFVIEATIEQGCWPLTAPEWNNVDKERQKFLIRPTASNVSTLMSKSSHLRQLENDGPRWTMEVYFNNCDHIAFYKDTEKDDLLKAIKQEYSRSHTAAFAKALKTREQFIREHSIPNPDLCLEPGKRSLNREIFLEKILPSVDWSKYYEVPIDEDTIRKARRMKTAEESWIFSYGVLARHLTDLSASEKSKIAMREFHKKEQKKLAVLNDWFDEIRRESENMMGQSYRQRERYIQHYKAKMLMAKSQIGKLVAQKNEPVEDDRDKQTLIE